MPGNDPDDNDCYVDLGDLTDRTSERDSAVSCEYLTGPAGSGKTYEIMRRMREAHGWMDGAAVVASTTGISAINLGTTTINSLLGYFDQESLEDAYASGQITRRLNRLQEEGVHRIVLDEVSMMPGGALEIVHRAVAETQGYVAVRRGEIPPMGFTITGDFAQLPPVKGSWAFEADCWRSFAQNTTRLTTQYRQADPRFLEAMGAIRSGDGGRGAAILRDLGVEFGMAKRTNFDGTTLVATNQEVDRFNFLCLQKVAGERFEIKSDRWGRARGEWKLIPERDPLRVGALVMLLANQRTESDPDAGWSARGSDLLYANGDLAHISAIVRDGETREVTGVLVKLKRNGSEQLIRQIERQFTIKEHPSKRGLRELLEGGLADQETAEWGTEWWDAEHKRFVIGAIRYFPLRLAYATTVHKCVASNTRVVSRLGGAYSIKDAEWGSRLVDGDIIGIATTFERACRIVTKRGYTVVCSPEHRWMVEGELTETRFIRAGDSIKLVEPIPPRVPDPAVHLADGIEFGWWLGALVGNGSYADDKEGQIHFAGRDRGVGERFAEYLRLKGLRCSWRGDMRGLHSTSKPFRSHLADRIGLKYDRAGTKFIPPAVWEGGWKVWAAFLQGLFDTDGSVGRSYVVLTTVSETLGQEVQEMLLLLGIPSLRRRYTVLYKRDRRGYWQIRIGAAGIEGYRKLVGFSQTKKKARLERLRPNRVIAAFDGTDEVADVRDCGMNVPMVDVETNAQGHLMGFGPFVGHNSQGLSLDSVQVDCTHNFFGSPNMAYVAMSRARTAEGLRIVGTPDMFARRVKMDPKIKGWV